MLNADGWVLVIWVNDWEIQDLNKLNNTQLNDYKQVVHEFILPPALIQIEEVVIEWKLIFLYHIDSDKERIFKRKDNEKVFFRNWDETIELDREWVRMLEYDKSIRKFEEENRRDFNEEDFRWGVIEYYKKKINYEWDVRDLLVNRNLAIKEYWNYI
jgi:ATP-dependent DNA helicase RecG